MVSVLMLGMMAGCIGIPVGFDTPSEKVLGKRMTQDGQEIGRIIEVERSKRYFYLMSPDGGGIRREPFIKFYSERNGKKYSLTHLAYTPGGYDVLQPVLPVQNSTKWVAGILEGVERDYVDLKLFVFDEKKVYGDIIVRGCVRTTRDRWGDLFNYGVEGSNGNSRIVCHTKNGRYIFDVLTSSLEKMDR